MKRIFTILTACLGIALLAVACQKSSDPSGEDNHEQQTGNDFPKEPYEYTMTGTGESLTKASYDADLSFSWEIGDEAAVVFNDGKTEKFFVLTAGSGFGSKMKFSATIDAGWKVGTLSGAKAAFYPASMFTLTADGVVFTLPSSASAAASIFPVAAVGNESDVYPFKAVAGYYGFTFTDLETESVTLEVGSPEGYALGGTLPLSLVDGRYVWAETRAGASQHSSLTFAVPVTDGTASVLVPYAAGGTHFQPSLTLTSSEGKTLYEEVPENALAAVKAGAVALQEAVSFAEIPPVVIDGEYDEWDEIEGAEGDKINVIKGIMDRHFLYIFFEAPSVENFHNTRLCLETDGDNTNGSSNWILGSQRFDCMINITSLWNDATGSVTYSDLAGGNTVIVSGGSDGVVAKAAGKQVGDVFKYEIALKRDVLEAVRPFSSDVVIPGIYVLNISWNKEASVVGKPIPVVLD